MKLRKLYLFSIYASESLPYHYLESFPSISFCEGFKMLKMSLGFFNLFYSLSSSSRIIYNISHWFSCWKRKGFSKRSDKLFIDDIIESTLSIKKSRVSYTISWDDRIKAFNIWSIFCFHCLFSFSCFTKEHLCTNFCAHNRILYGSQTTTYNKLFDIRYSKKTEHSFHKPKLCVAKYLLCFFWRKSFFYMLSLHYR